MFVPASDCTFKMTPKNSDEQIYMNIQKIRNPKIRNPNSGSPVFILNKMYFFYINLFHK
jgi:hypothetical protein